MQINLTRAQQLLPLALGSAPISPPERVRRLCLAQMRQPCCDCRNFWGRRTGVRLTIPMAGHPIAAAEEVGARGEAEALEALVRAHHCVFLLTDTRESRWLPSLLCASAGVLAINAALGFDRCRRPPPFHVTSTPIAIRHAQFDVAVVPNTDLGSIWMRPRHPRFRWQMSPCLPSAQVCEVAGEVLCFHESTCMLDALKAPGH